MIPKTVNHRSFWAAALLGLVILFSLAGGLTSAWAETNASTWYVRPLGGDYGLKDGSSYANAFDGLENVIWGAGGVEPGDTLMVCGAHVNRVTSRAGLGIERLIATGSGTSEDNRIIIDGACPDDPGVVWGAGILAHEDWADEGGGVWSILPPTGMPPMPYFQDIGASSPESHIVMQKYDTLEELRNSNGGYWSPAHWQTPPERLYVKTTDGGNPTGRIAGPWYGYFFDLTERQYVTFRNLAMYKSPWGQGSFAANMHHITWDSDKIFYDGLAFYDGHHDIQVLNSEIAWAGNGIYNITQTNDGPYNYVYSGNYIHDIGLHPVLGVLGGDNHGIGIQGGHDGVITDNVFERASSGITLYAYLGQDLYNVEIARNFIKDMIDGRGGGNGRGIETSEDYKTHSNRSNIIIHHNIIDGCTIGVRDRFEWDVMRIYNNAISNCDVGIGLTGATSLVVYRDGSLLSQGKVDVLVGAQSQSAVMVRGGIREDVNLPGSSGSFSYNALYTLHFVNGSTEPQVGDYLDGNQSNATGKVRKLALSSGSWAAGDAAGVVYLDNADGTFQNDETLSIHQGTANALQLSGAAIAPVDLQPGERLLLDGVETVTVVSQIVAGPRADVKNNIIRNPSAQHISMTCNTPEYCQSTIDYNLYYPDGPTLFNYLGSQTDLAGWRAHAEAGMAFGAHSLADDPQFTNASGSYTQASDFLIPATSPAVDAGSDVGLTEDFVGNPIAGPPDMGAYEYQPDSPPTPEPTPTITPEPTSTTTPGPAFRQYLPWIAGH